MNELQEDGRAAMVAFNQGIAMGRGRHRDVPKNPGDTASRNPDTFTKTADRVRMCDTDRGMRRSS
jgi:hypothetical protein